MDQTLISIIMPAYNAEKFISASIKSVLNQTYNNWELIIINDGSTDKTAEVIDFFARQDRRIKIIFQENKKQGIARNTGINHSGGEIIAFLDADDFWEHDKLELMNQVFCNSDCALVFSDAYILNDKSCIKEKTFGVDNAIYEGKGGIELFLYYNRIPLLTVLVEKKALVEVGLFSDRGICEDYELWLKLLLKGYRFESVSKPLATYRLHTGSTTNYDKLAIDQSIDVIYSIFRNNSQGLTRLFENYLKVWYKRKLEVVSNYTEYRKFTSVFLIQNRENLMLNIIARLNVNKYFFSLHKRLLLNILK